MLMETTTDSSSSSQQPHLPPGFRFHPTDEELVVDYLKKKASSSPLPVNIIAEVDLYKFDPWELPGKATFGDQEWYFFSPRDRKYPNGARPNRAATSGYWKATGTDKPILTSGGTQKVGVKKALVFYSGKPPKGVKSSWIMHEYRLADNNESSMKPPCIHPANKNTSLRLDDWVLCRIYKKNSSQRLIEKDDSLDDMLASLPTSKFYYRDHEPNYNPKFNENDENFFNGLLGSSNTEGINQFVSTSSSASTSSSFKPIFSGTLPSSTTESTQTLKRTLPSPYWPDTTGITMHQSAKKFHTNNNMDGNYNSDNSGNYNDTNENVNNGSNDHTMAALLNQLPQVSPVNHQVLLGSLGDGFFRQPYHNSNMNWNP
ncbi:hypothetical protein MKW92_033681 [Papaver armeniacum]|nr:hypothetical protein MKW92_033681 [Papaver armeniacum]